MTTLIEGRQGFYLCSTLELLDVDDKETAFSLASRNQAYSYLVGRYVTAEVPNLNQHLFMVADLETHHQTVINSPLNINHDPRRLVGTHIDSKVVRDNPTQESAFDGHPHMEVLAVVWKYYQPSDYRLIQTAHESQTAALSMESVPETVTCTGEGGCGQTFAYAGRRSPTYCDELNHGQSLKQMNNPHFTGGAVVVPPEKPAWKDASVMELSKYDQMLAHLHESKDDDFEDMDPVLWEETMLEILRLAEV